MEEFNTFVVDVSARHLASGCQAEDITEYYYKFADWKWVCGAKNLMSRFQVVLPDDPKYKQGHFYKAHQGVCSVCAISES